MGRSVSGKYAVTIRVHGYAYSPMPWNCRQSGRPADASLAKYVRDFEDSTRPGGCNDHLGRQYVNTAYVTLNEAGGRRVAQYSAPMFTAI